MTQAQLVTDLTNDVVMAAFLSSVLFAATYSALAPGGDPVSAGRW